MIYDQEIDWRDPNKGIGVIGPTHDPFKSSVIDYQIEMEARITDLINIHFRNPKAYDVERAPLRTRMEILRALIGPTPDDDVWEIIKVFSSLRNSLAHKETAYTKEGIKGIEQQTVNFFKAVQKVRPEYIDAVATDKNSWSRGRR